MNFNLKNIPERTVKPRVTGVTMVIDKGSSIQECKNLIETSSKYVDFVKFGWTTANFSEHLKEKIKLFKDANINVYFGGTLFEAFAIRDQFDYYIDIINITSILHSLYIPLPIPSLSRTPIPKINIKTTMH